MMLNKFYVLLSGATSNPDEDNTALVRDYLRNGVISFEECLGVYKGECEVSFCALADDFGAVGDLLRLAKNCDQESIMVVDARNKAFLIYCDDCRIESLGQMFQSENCVSYDSYTLLNGIYYYTI